MRNQETTGFKSPHSRRNALSIANAQQRKVYSVNNGIHPWQNSANQLRWWRTQSPKQHHAFYRQIVRTCGGGIGAEQVFFPLSIYASVAKIQPNKVVRWCRDGDFFASWISIFQRAVCSTFQTCILNLHKGHTMRRSMVDIHSATAEIRQGKKRRNQRAKI